MDHISQLIALAHSCSPPDPLSLQLCINVALYITIASRLYLYIYILPLHILAESITYGINPFSFKMSLITPIEKLT